MTKTKLIVARLAVVAILIVSLTAIAAFAFADEAAAPQTREFNKSFDRMLNDLSGTDGVIPAYRHVEWQAGQADDFNNAIYKLGSESLTQNLASITLTVRSDNTRLDDLMLGMRNTDNKDESIAHLDLADRDSYPVEFGTGDDIGSEWTTMTFQLTDWDFDFNDESHTAFDGNNVVGFHLYSKGEAGSLDIQKVECANTSGATTVLQDFSGTFNAYWDDSEADTYTNIGRHYAITDSRDIVSDEATSNNADGKYSAIVLAVAGSGSVKVAPVKADGSKGTEVAWANLTDLEGTAVPALTTAVQYVVISLESLGETAIKGVELAVTGGEVDLYGAFFTNMETRPPEEAPRLDVDSISYMSKFDFEYKFPADWSPSSVDAAAQYGFDYMIAYNNDAYVSVTDGHLVFDGSGNVDYINAKLRSKTVSGGKDYLVIKYKLDNGATLDNFRFDVITVDPDNVVGRTTFFHDLLASFGTPSESTPYFSDNGYSYLVVDIEENFGVTDIAGVDLYYTGGGKLLIDEIFYVNKLVPKMNLSENILTEDRTFTIEAGSGYLYGTGFDLDGKAHDGIAVTMKATEGATLTPVRFEFAGTGATRWFRQNDEGVLRDIYGNMFPDVSTEEQTYIIDYAQSGITGAATNLHFHTYKLDTAVTYTITSIQYVDYVNDYDTTDEVLAQDFAGKEFTAPAAGYQYVGWASGEARTGMDYAILEVEGDISQLRIQFDGTYLWISENEAGSLLDRHGDRFATSGKQTLVIDLAKSGVPETVKDIHFHNDFAQIGDVLKITSLKFAKQAVVPYEEIVSAIPVNDDSKPVIDTFEVPSTGTVGQEITVTVTASDNYSATAALTVAVSVTVDGKAVTVSGNKFTPDAAGTYTVTVTVTDEKNNVVTESKAITVKAAGTQPGGSTGDNPGGNTGDNPGSSGEPSQPQQPDKGLPGWAIALIVIGAVAVVGGAVVGVIFARKRKSK